MALVLRVVSVDTNKYTDTQWANVAQQWASLSMYSEVQTNISAKINMEKVPDDPFSPPGVACC